MPHLVSQVNLIYTNTLLVSEWYITHHFWEPLRRPTKIKIKAKAWLLSTGIALLGQFRSPEAAPWEGPLYPSLILALSSGTLHWCMLIRSAKGILFFQIGVLAYLFAWMRQCLPLPTIIIVRSPKESFFSFCHLHFIPQKATAEALRNSKAKLQVSNLSTFSFKSWNYWQSQVLCLRTQIPALNS